MTKTLRVAQKTLRELWREPLLLGLMFLFPVMLLGFYYIAFGETDEGLAKHLKVWVENQDLGAPTEESQSWRAGEQLVDLMRGIKFEGAPVFHLMPVTDPRAAEISLREHKATLWLRIPPDFSQKLAQAAAGDLSTPTTLSLIGDPHAHNYLFAQSLIEQLVREFIDCTLAWQDDELVVDYAYLAGTGTTSDFEFGVPGMIVFGVMLLVVTTAQILVRERVNRTLRRLRLTRLSAGELLLGVTLAQMAVALVMVPFTFGAAWLMGFQGQGSLPLAMGIGLLLNLGAVGIGLIVACFVGSESEAANLGATAGVLMVIVSGAMYPMPDVPLFRLAGQTVQVYDLLPTTHAAEALRRVLLFGEGVGGIGYELAGLSLLSGLFLAAGVGLYQQFQLPKT